MKKRTAKNTNEVRIWVETREHHKAAAEPEINPKFMVLTGNQEQLRIPVEIHKQCFLKPSKKFDNRMYRWDFETEARFTFKMTNAESIRQVEEKVYFIAQKCKLDFDNPTQELFEEAQRVVKRFNAHNFTDVEVKFIPAVKADPEKDSLDLNDEASPAKLVFIIASDPWNIKQSLEK